MITIEGKCIHTYTRMVPGCLGGRHSIFSNSGPTAVAFMPHVTIFPAFGVPCLSAGCVGRVIDRGGRSSLPSFWEYYACEETDREGGFYFRNTVHIW